MYTVQRDINTDTQISLFYDKSLMNLKDLQKKYNLSDLELFSQDTSTHKVSFTANKLKQTESTHTSGNALRLIKNKRLGFAATHGKSNLEKMLNKALETSKFSSEIDFKLPGKIQKIEEVKINKESLSSFIEKGKELIEEILYQIPNVLTDISFEVTNSKETIKNTKDLNYSYSKELYSFLINIRETLENDFFDIYTAVIDDRFPDYRTYASELVQYYKLSKKHLKIKNGIFPVLFTSKATKELLEVLELALNGKQINQKSSPWHNMLGKQITSKLITIKQDPLFGYMTRSIDDEGSVIKPLTFINHGTLENFYFDLSSACRCELQPIPTAGNGFKPSLSSQPEPTPLNMIISAGLRPINQIIKDINYGLLIDQTMGGLSTNISGDMSVNVDVGFLIERGEITGRVKDTMVTGNIYSAFNNILELSNNLKQHWSHIYSPDMLIDGFTITSK